MKVLNWHFNIDKYYFIYSTSIYENLDYFEIYIYKYKDAYARPWANEFLFSYNSIGNYYIINYFKLDK